MRANQKAPWNVGVIGLGLMGRRMLGSLASHGDFRVIAGFDADADVGRTVAAQAEFGLATDVQELLQRFDLDLVYVATPPASHVPLAREVLQSGRALLLEKPLAVDLQSARELVRMAEASELPSAMNFPFASLPGLGQIEEELRDGTAGKPLRVEVVLHFSQWPRTWHKAGAWLAGDREGGFLREVFSHFAYLTQRLLGPLQVQSCSLEAVAGVGETRVAADLRAGDVPVALMGGAGGAAPDFNRWTLFCEQRCYRVEDWAKVSVSTTDAWHAIEASGGRSQLDELAALMDGQPHCLPSLRDGLGVMSSVESLLQVEP